MELLLPQKCHVQMQGLKLTYTKGSALTCRVLSHLAQKPCLGCELSEMVLQKGYKLNR